MRLLVAVLLFCVAMPTATPRRVVTEPWQPYVLGAPCSLSSDWENGRCLFEGGIDIKWKPSRVKRN